MRSFLNESNISWLEIYLAYFCTVRVNLFDSREMGIINLCGRATCADRYRKTIPYGSAKPWSASPTCSKVLPLLSPSPYTSLEAHVIETFASAKSQIIAGQETSAKAVWVVFMNVNLES